MALTQSQESENTTLLEIKKQLDSVSPSLCLAKWLHVSLHLTTGKTHSCYHPPVHSIDREEIKKNPSALHNTAQKKKERAQMIAGQRPEGCSYCWRMEDSQSPYSDRHYRSLEPWARPRFNEVVKGGSEYNVIPSYVEVNFNQACQFKCSYCSPHLSTTWMEESQKYGPWPTINPHNNIEGLKKSGLWPVSRQEDNPYVEAFWKWWPELYPQLKVFRMTGGEPLIDPNTFRVLDYIEKHSNPSLELAITTNLCPPEKMKNRFVRQVKNVLDKKHIFRFMIYPSIDTWGPQAEYIRYGLDTEAFEKNVIQLLKEAPDLLMSFIITTNALSVFSLKDLLKKILKWQKEFSYIGGGHKRFYRFFGIKPMGFRRLFLDLPWLRAPAWQALDVLPEGMAEKYLQDCLKFMEKNQVNMEKGKYHGFALFHIDKMKRLLNLLKQPVDKEKQKLNRINFYKFFSEHDRRRNTNFLKTFPELKRFWFQCEKLAREWDQYHPDKKTKN
ncbi:MAG: twitch domain-containing radical SAM protein [Bdellovibrionales bacterium]|nr:twitch domain-containing radical SAM protein [Bdellovibrionales bacterium]